MTALLLDIFLWAIVIVLGLMLAARSQPLFLDSLRFAAREFMALLPRIALGMIGSGFIAEILPQQWMMAWFGPGTGPLAIGGPLDGLGPLDEAGLVGARMRQACDGLTILGRQLTEPNLGRYGGPPAGDAPSYVRQLAG